MSLNRLTGWRGVAAAGENGHGSRILVGLLNEAIGGADQQVRSDEATRAASRAIPFREVPVGVRVQPRPNQPVEALSGQRCGRTGGPTDQACTISQPSDAFGQQRSLGAGVQDKGQGYLVQPAMGGL